MQKKSTNTNNQEFNNVKKHFDNIVKKSLDIIDVDKFNKLFQIIKECKDKDVQDFIKDALPENLFVKNRTEKEIEQEMKYEGNFAAISMQSNESICKISRQLLNIFNDMYDPNNTSSLYLDTKKVDGVFEKKKEVNNEKAKKVDGVFEKKKEVNDEKAKILKINNKLNNYKEIANNIIGFLKQQTNFDKQNAKTTFRKLFIRLSCKIALKNKELQNELQATVDKQNEEEQKQRDESKQKLKLMIKNAKQMLEAVKDLSPETNTASNLDNIESSINSLQAGDNKNNAENDFIAAFSKISALYNKACVKLEENNNKINNKSSLEILVEEQDNKDHIQTRSKNIIDGYISKYKAEITSNNNKFSLNVMNTNTQKINDINKAGAQNIKDIKTKILQQLESYEDFVKEIKDIDKNSTKNFIKYYSYIKTEISQLNTVSDSLYFSEYKNQIQQLNDINTKLAKLKKNKKDIEDELEKDKKKKEEDKRRAEENKKIADNKENIENKRKQIEDNIKILKQKLQNNEQYLETIKKYNEEFTLGNNTTKQKIENIKNESSELNTEIAKLNTKLSKLKTEADGIKKYQDDEQVPAESKNCRSTKLEEILTKFNNIQNGELKNIQNKYKNIEQNTQKFGFEQIQIKKDEFKTTIQSLTNEGYKSDNISQCEAQINDILKDKTDSIKFEEFGKDHQEGEYKKVYNVKIKIEEINKEKQIKEENDEIKQSKEEFEAIKNEIENNINDIKTKIQRNDEYLQVIQNFNQEFDIESEDTKAEIEGIKQKQNALQEKIKGLEGKLKELKEKNEKIKEYSNNQPLPTGEELCSEQMKKLIEKLTQHKDGELQNIINGTNNIEAQTQQLGFHQIKIKKDEFEETIQNLTNEGYSDDNISQCEAQINDILKDKTDSIKFEEFGKDHQEGEYKKVYDINNIINKTALKNFTQSILEVININDKQQKDNEKLDTLYIQKKNRLANTTSNRENLVKLDKISQEINGSYLDIKTKTKDLLSKINELINKPNTTKEEVDEIRQEIENNIPQSKNQLEKKEQDIKNREQLINSLLLSKKGEIITNNEVSISVLETMPKKKSENDKQQLKPVELSFFEKLLAFCFELFFPPIAGLFIKSGDTIRSYFIKKKQQEQYSKLCKQTQKTNNLQGGDDGNKNTQETNNLQEKDVEENMIDNKNNKTTFGLSNDNLHIR